MLTAGTAAHYASAASDPAVLTRGYAISGEGAALANLLAAGRGGMAPAIAAISAGDPSLFRKNYASFQARFPELGCAFTGSWRVADEVAVGTGVNCYWMVAPGVPATAPVIINLHGGGRYGGVADPTATIEGAMCEAVSRQANARILSVDYMLAPEANGSTQVAECLKVYAYVLNEMNIPSARVAWMGGSGGGSLALSVVLAIAARKLPSPAAAYVLSPMADGATWHPSMEANRDSDHAVGHSADAWTAKYRFLTGEGPEALPLTHPDVSPLHGDYAGVCPLYISASTREVCFDEGVAVVKKARAAGVAVRASISPSMPHMWAAFAPYVPESREELALGARWLAEHIHVGFGDVV